jgi:hypothetical protein
MFEMIDKDVVVRCILGGMKVVGGGEFCGLIAYHTLKRSLYQIQDHVTTAIVFYTDLTNKANATVTCQYME